MCKVSTLTIITFSYSSGMHNTQPAGRTQLPNVLYPALGAG